MSTVATTSRSTPAPTSAVGWRRREVELAARATELHGAAVEILGADADGMPALDEARPWRTASVVTGMLRSCIEAMRSAPQPDEPEVHAVCLVVPDLQRLASEIIEHNVHLRGRRLAECEDGLSRLQSLPSSGDLIDQTCEVLARRCGFGRAMLSRVEGDSWRPWTGHFAADGSVPPWFHDWVNRKIPLGTDSIESQTVRERTPAIAHATVSGSVLGSLLIDASGARSYVVAPILEGDEVVGLLHADHHPTDRPVDETDRSVLERYAEGFAQVYERAVLAERLDDQRDRVREALTATKRMMDELSASPITLGAPGQDLATRPIGPGAPAAPDPASFDGLTPRERDVLDLMLTGAGNHAIAEQLVIAPGTVKFHVQNILRKLGAVNRAQAIASCLNLHPAQQG
ncbi:LuxR C-terminal-related transcriptional regulator [Patulibacter minatonensis]|uniref:LuxR C-terminal-related transcriptional regulator n=1 Tax=Patulibacter minatonensis TaxID=298163 RepID=UPI00047C70F7|nr:LuxR C-terminal-related transcriptional regulator [Patulibacter minatonensis]